MTSKKRNTLIICSIAVFALTVGGWAVASEYGGKFWCKGDPDCVMERMDEKVKDLNLTAAQQKKFDALKAEVRTKVVEGREKRREFFAKMKTELAAKNPDPDKIVAMLKSKMTDIQGHMSQGLDRISDFYQSLNTEQQQKVLSRLREKMDRFEKFGPHHGRGRES